MPYPEAYRRATVRRAREAIDYERAPRSSNAAIPFAIVLFVIALYLGTITILAPALLGLFLLVTAVSFFSSRINPFSLGFYLTRKPSWAAVGTLLLAALGLFLITYLYWIHGIGPIFPGTKP